MFPISFRKRTWSFLGKPWLSVAVALWPYLLLSSIHTTLKWRWNPCSSQCSSLFPISSYGFCCAVCLSGTPIQTFFNWLIFTQLIFTEPLRLLLCLLPWNFFPWTKILENYNFPLCSQSTLCTTFLCLVDFNYFFLVCWY